MDWENLYTAVSPYVPRVDSELDTRNFDKYEEEPSKGLSKIHRLSRKADPNFIGYTFKNFEAVQSDASKFWPPSSAQGSTIIV